MKKFNIEKWEAMQRRKAEMSHVYRMASDDFEHEQREYIRKYQHFAGSYRECDTALAVIERDAKTLSSSEIADKIQRIVNDWPALCEEFNVTEGFTGKHILTGLYKQMRERQKTREAKEQAAEAQGNYIRCFNALDEFAAKHGKGDKTGYAPMPDSGPLGVQSVSDYPLV